MFTVDDALGDYGNNKTTRASWRRCFFATTCSTLSSPMYAPARGFSFKSSRFSALGLARDRLPYAASNHTTTIRRFRWRISSTCTLPAPSHSRSRSHSPAHAHFFSLALINATTFSSSVSFLGGTGRRWRCDGDVAGKKRAFRLFVLCLAVFRAV